MRKICFFVLAALCSILTIPDIGDVSFVNRVWRFLPNQTCVLGCATAATNESPVAAGALKSSRNAPGAKLPIAFDIKELMGTLFWLSPHGEDSNLCTMESPCLSLARAYKMAASGDTIVVRGGIYRGSRDFQLKKQLVITAYPGEKPVFSGARAVDKGEWIEEGPLSYISYAPIVVTDGAGIPFSTCESNSRGGASCVGRFADQAWVGSRVLQQVARKTDVIAGKFWVDESGPLPGTISIEKGSNHIIGTGTTFTASFQPGDQLQHTKTGAIFTISQVVDDQTLIVTNAAENTIGRSSYQETNSRLYVSTVDADQPNFEVSDARDFLTIVAPGVTIKGISVTRYSNDANQYGVIDVEATADGLVMEDVDISEGAFQLLHLNGITDDLLENVTLRRISLRNGNFVGLSGLLCSEITIESALISGLDPFDEFSNSPMSGGLKLTRAWHVKLLSSRVSGNNSHGAWFDQSSYDIELFGNTIFDNAGAAVFFEISDHLLLINNFLQSSVGNALKFGGGSSGLYAINNTMVGGADVVGVYTDIRSKEGCSDPNQPLCPGAVMSDRDKTRPFATTMDWMPRIQLLINNIIAYPTAAGLCGGITALCITDHNSGTRVAPESIIHGFDARRDLPATRMDHNVYAVSEGSIARLPRTGGDESLPIDSAAALADALARPPYNLPDLERHSLTGAQYVNADGSPTELLSGLNSTAEPVPEDPAIGAYLPPGLRHYGDLLAP